MQGPALEMLVRVAAWRLGHPGGLSPATAPLHPGHVPLTSHGPIHESRPRFSQPPFTSHVPASVMSHSRVTSPISSTSHVPASVTSPFTSHVPAWLDGPSSASAVLLPRALRPATCRARQSPPRMKGPQPVIVPACDGGAAGGRRPALVTVTRGDVEGFLDSVIRHCELRASAAGAGAGARC